MIEDIRKKLITSCDAYLVNKKLVLTKAMNALKEDLENESKSSAGDKYETGREMINIEWNKLSNQLNQYEQLSVILSRIRNHQPNGNIMLGSIIKTETANYFISVPVGEIKTDNDKFYAVGAQAPVAKLLFGRKIGDSFRLNGKEQKIVEII